MINISAGGPFQNATNLAVASATAAGLTVVVSAGNDNQAVSLVSPASAATAITVGAVDGTDQRAWFSNWGALVNIFAPGVSVLSAYIGGGPTGSVYMSGTSMGKSISSPIS